MSFKEKVWKEDNPHRVFSEVSIRTESLVGTIVCVKGYLNLLPVTVDKIQKHAYYFDTWRLCYTKIKSKSPKFRNIALKM